MKLPPSPPAHFIFGHIPEIKKNSLGFFLKLQRHYGDLSCFKIWSQPNYLLVHPEHVKHIFHDRWKDYTKNTKPWQKFRQFLGESIVTSSGDYWKKQRRIAQPSFSPQKLKAYSEMMIHGIQDTLKSWETIQDPIELTSEMMTLTLHIVGDTLFGTQLRDEVAIAAKALPTIVKRVSNHTAFPLWVPTSFNRKYAQAVREMDEIVLKIIRDRRNSASQGEDFLSQLIRGEESQEMTDNQLRNEVMTFLFAGHETTAHSLTWTLYLLSKHPEIRRQLKHEIQTRVGDRVPTLEDLTQFPYLDCVIKESMRLYPAAPIIGRTAEVEDEIDSYRIPKGATVVLSPYVTQRHPDFWENPEGFDPERFSPERFSNQHRFAYFPFGAGPRQCIGNSFAHIEMQLALILIHQKYELDLLAGEKSEPQAVVTLRPKNPIWVKMIKEKNT